MKKIENQTGKHRFHANMILAAAAVGLAVTATGCTTQTTMPDTLKVQNVEGNTNQISVTGRETVKVVPDMSTIIFAIRTQAETAEQCQQDNAKDLDATIQELKDLGVAETSIQTSSYDMNPIYDWNSSDQQITGYEMNTQLTVTDIPIDQAGALLSNAVITGVNSIEQVQYFCSSYDENYQEALKKAIAMAHTKATAMAEAEGHTIDQVVSMEEQGYYPEARYASMTSGYGANKMESTSAAMDMSVMAGQIEVEATVNVTYSMK